MLEIKNLKVMQDGFRLPEQQILEMIRFVENGGRFTTESLAKHNPNRTSLIAITQFEDGQLFIRDGFHRTAAIILGRHGSDIPQTSVLFEDEYVIEPMTYDMFLKTNIHNGWYTPFDPRIEVRKSDFFDFKEDVIKQISMSWLDSTINEFILENKDRYVVPRQKHHDPFVYADEMWERLNNVV